jgi:preprotein translocase subunit SecG
MYEILLIVYLLIALFLIFMILIQQGKGADMGASFGAGSSNTLFGASGSGNFLTKLTTALATGFFVISIILGNMTANQVKKTDEFSDISVGDAATEVQAEQAPSGDAPASDIPLTNSQNEDAPASDIPAEAEDKSAEESEKK